MALMRFTSTEPSVRVGVERDFAVYDELRDNWWCSDPDWNVRNLPPEKRTGAALLAAIVPRIQRARPALPPMPIAPPSMAKWPRLEELPASDYFAQEALDWVN